MRKFAVGAEGRADDDVGPDDGLWVDGERSARMSSASRFSTSSGGPVTLARACRFYSGFESLIGTTYSHMGLRSYRLFSCAALSSFEFSAVPWRALISNATFPG